MRTSTIPLLVATALAAGCGGGKAEDAKVREGAAVYTDALKDNQGGWVVAGNKMYFDGRYQWERIPVGKSPVATADALLAKHIPAGLAVSANVEVREGAALRAIACREVGPRDQEPRAWYELGVDGRQALIRRMSVSAAPKVLARVERQVPNGKRVRLTGQCVPDADGGLVLALRVDGTEVVRARDAKPLPAAEGGVEASPSIRAYPRPDTPSPVALTWDDFEVRSASVK